MERGGTALSATTFRPVRVSAMHGVHRGLGATFKDDGDWRVPNVFTTTRAEVERALAGVGVADVSAGGRLAARGEAVEAWLAKVAAVDPLPVGTASRVRVDGNDALTCRLAPDEVLVLTETAETAAVTDVLARAAAGFGCVHLTDLTSGLAAMDLVGPGVSRLLAKVVPVDLSPATVPVLGVVQGELARVHATLIRLDRARVPAFRALVAREYGAFVWEALADAGRELGLVPVGAAARAILDDRGEGA